MTMPTPNDSVSPGQLRLAGMQVATAGGPKPPADFRRSRLSTIGGELVSPRRLRTTTPPTVDRTPTRQRDPSQRSRKQPTAAVTPSANFLHTAKASQSTAPQTINALRKPLIHQAPGHTTTIIRLISLTVTGGRPMPGAPEPMPLAEYLRMTARAKGSRRSPAMNGIERGYQYYLDALRAGGLLLEVAFEPEKLRIGTDHTCTYTPDFRIVRSDGIIEFHEVKGGKVSRTNVGHKAYWHEDARVKIKAADAAHPYIFRAVHKIPVRIPGDWFWENITPDLEAWPDLLDRLQATATEHKS